MPSMSYVRTTLPTGLHACLALLLALVACLMAPVPHAAADEGEQGMLAEAPAQAPLVQEGDAVPAQALDASLAQDEVDALHADAYPLATSKPDQLRARIHTQLSAMATVIDVRDLHIKRSEVDIATLYAEVVNADPDLFFVTSGFRYQWYDKRYLDEAQTQENPVYDELAYIRPAAISNQSGIVQPFAFPVEQVAQMREAYEAALADALSWVPTGASDAAKAKAVHDWLVDHCSYNNEAAASSPAEYGWGPWTSYGALVESTPVCQGYSLAFLAAMNRLGVPASYVTHPSEKHGWNRVMVDGSWYNLDVTFDDAGTHASDFYFLRSDAWWTNNLDGAGYHASWKPAGEAGDSTRFDGTPAWTRYTAAGGSLGLAAGMSLALAGSTSPLETVYMACDEGIDLSLVQVQPADANTALAQWSSSDASVAAIDNAGRLTSGSTPGRATVTCTLGDATASIEVLVEAADLSRAPIEAALFPAQLSYTGSEQRPTLSRVLLHATTGDIVLEEGIDYRLAWPADCTSAGAKELAVEGIGSFTGTLVLPFAIVKGATSWTRLAGANALGTMSAIVQTSHASSDVAIIATMDGYWDALSASSLAGAHAAPVLLTKGSALSSETRTQLKRLGVRKAYICGGPKAVSAQVERQVQNLGIETTRVAGADARGTACAVFKQLGSARASSTCLVATSASFHDALSASPLSYAMRAPVFLCNGTTLDAQTLSCIRSGGFERIVVLGGTAAVSANVQRQLSSIAPVVRLAGANAYGTSQAIASYEVQHAGFAASRVALATGKGYWDALSGASLCGSTLTPLVLADEGRHTAIDGYIGSHRGQIAQGFVLGGPAAVTDTTMQAAVKAAS